MRITNDDVVAGLPARQVRDALKHCRGENGFYSELLTKRLGVTEAEGARVLAALVDGGYVEPFDDDWRTTTAGNALAMANAGHPIKRATAQRAYDAFLDRVEKVNASDDFVDSVAAVVLFGSFLDPERDPVNDVDVAVEIAPKEMDPDVREAKQEERRQVAERAGRSFATIVDRLFWPSLEVMLYLRSRSRVLSIAAARDPVLKQTASRVVYTAEKGRV